MRNEIWFFASAKFVETIRSNQPSHLVNGLRNKVIASKNTSANSFWNICKCYIGNLGWEERETS